GLRRYFPPNDFEYHRDLMEIYVDLAEVWLRKRDFKMCQKVCRRAEQIATRALKKWPERNLLYDVHRALGDLYFQEGQKPQEYERARKAYQTALKYAHHD